MDTHTLTTWQLLVASYLTGTVVTALLKFFISRDPSFRHTSTVHRAYRFNLATKLSTRAHFYYAVNLKTHGSWKRQNFVQVPTSPFITLNKKRAAPVRP
ncbi:hypothetical protein SGGMMB4_02661 [Sodalis glossinidius str. 'morsitans']|uniref:Uncharacterized protein n=1 Tax=Sodalis glossinidius (strain morsitans) TaxID=343509 RepID=A0A193QIX6_SODGM|nr:GhoT/OrtT family toxin [Sodalis glossinidius]CRL45121.1 hypothetical protein SGGMMB4_02661 [Sodalis glossinidius str. 'morsitans']